MIIEALEISHFGKFHDLALNFDPGINVLTGANEAGKTTLACFIRAMLFGTEEDTALQDRFLPFDDDGVYGGSMRIRYRGRSWLLSRSFIPGAETVSVQDAGTGEEAEDPDELLLAFRAGLTREQYDETGFLSENCWFSDELRRQDSRRKEKDTEETVPAPDPVELFLIRDRLELSGKAEEEREKLSELRAELLEAQEKLRDAEIQADSLKDMAEEDSSGVEERRLELHRLKEDLEKVVSSENAQKGKTNILGTLFVVLASLTALVSWFLVRALGIGRSDPYFPYAAGAAAASVLFLILGLVFTIRNIAAARSCRMLAGIEEKLRQDTEQAEIAYQRALDVRNEAEGKRKLYFRAKGESASLMQRIEELSGEISDRNRELSDIEARLEESEEQMSRMSLSDVTVSGDGEDAEDEEERDRRVRLWFGRITGRERERAPEESLSQAARQSLYLSERLAELEERDPEGELPLIMDDVFANFDSDRLRAVLGALKGISRQVFLFSCQSREQREL